MIKKIIIICAVFISISGQVFSEENLIPLSGGFIQLWNEDIMYKDDTWNIVLNEMSAEWNLNMDKVVINYSQTRDAEGKLISFIQGEFPEGQSPVSMILKYANEYNMKVFIGLNHHKDNGKPEITSSKEFLNDSIRTNLKLAKKINDLYKDNKSFYGWYLPLELWTGIQDKEKIDNWHEYYKCLGDGLKKLSPEKKILISPFINHCIIDTCGKIDVESNYKKILKHTQIDFLALQDHLGADSVDIKNMKRIEPVFESMKKACEANGIDFWVNVESFEGIGSKAIATNILNLREQIRIASKYTNKIITFDFFHYMNSYVHIKCNQCSEYYQLRKNEYICRAKALNRGYRRLFNLERREPRY
ncbi:MAG: DUF4434 domain-containing protein [Candidatus Electrothrix sp. AR1]|nr:DUF4434 domain-containing protein [Candidatus Electrothrix sp. AR1]